MSITRIAIERPITTVMFYLGVIVISVVALLQLPIDLMPDVSFPTISVVVEYPGAGPEEVETLLAKPLEEALGSVANVMRIDTYCQEERAVLRMRFEWGSDLNVVSDDIRQRVDGIRDNLPEDAEQPGLFKYDLSMSPIVRFGVAGDLEPRELRQLAEDKLRPRLERIGGVAAVEIRGGLRREIQVKLHSDKLNALNIPAQLVVDRIREENLDLPAGEVSDGELNVLVRTHGEFTSLEEIRNLVLDTRNAIPVSVRDVADVEDGREEEREVMRINGRSGISLRVVKQSEANTVDVARRVKEEVARIEREMPHLTFATLFDSSGFIEDAIAGVRSAAIFGSGLAIVILLIFLRSMRSTFIIATAIPVAVMASFALIYFAGFTLNIVSFGGLALAIGMLVDNSIVVLENIFRHRERGENNKEAALKGTQEVSLAIVASTLTTVVVFIPLLFLTGPAEVMFGQLSYVVSFGLICSLVVSLTLTPMLAARWLRVESLEATANETLLHKIFRISEYGFEKLDDGYRKLLHAALAHRAAVLYLSLVMLAMAVPFLRGIPFEYMPATDEGEVDIRVRFQPGTRLETMDQAMRLLEESASKEMAGEIKHLETSFGESSWWRGGGGNEGEIELALHELDERSLSSEEIAAELRKKLVDIPGIEIRTRPSGGLFIFRILQGDDSISVDIRGHHREQADYAANEVRAILEGIPGISDAYISQDDPRPDLGIEIDRQKAAEFGLSVADIARTLRIKYGGQDASVYREGGDEYMVKVRLAEADRRNPSSLADLWLITPQGERVAVSNFVKQRRGEGPSSINRVDKERSVTVAASMEPGVALGNIMREVQARLDRLPLPENFTLAYGGEWEDQQDSYRQLFFGLLLALILIYMVMASQFESLVHPAILMFAIPFAAIGVAIALLTTGTTLNIQSILGITMLAGIAVNNAIVLVDYINMLRREQGMPLQEAVEYGGRCRLRPILMTTLTTLLGLIPMSLAIGAGGELQAPMARVVLGGLISSTLITLLFVPVLYTAIEEFWERRSSKADARAQSVASAEDAPASVAK
ncbi:MAG: efflux RND transporter permease subunit [Candidatus Hydrogenedentes bacterium]|nr:efflux RND transporter permease subunit [Candidatus Hydrogenedentota bacterium]